MFLPIGVLAASLLATAVSAQGQNSSLPAGFNPGAISADEKASWCVGQSNTCVKVCQFAKVNRCNSISLTYDCQCQNGTTPDMAPFINSLPFFICQANFGQCIKNNPSDAEAQQACKDDKKKCGSRNATDIDHDGSSATTTTAEDSEPTETETDSSDDAEETESNAAATTTEATPEPTDNAAVIQVTQNYSLGVLISVFLAVFGYLV